MAVELLLPELVKRPGGRGWPRICDRQLFYAIY